MTEGLIISARAEISARVNWAEILLRLHDELQLGLKFQKSLRMPKLTIQPGLKFRFDYIEFFRFSGPFARAELRPGLNPSPCNRQFDFKRICLRSRAEVSARLTGLKFAM